MKKVVLLFVCCLLAVSLAGLAYAADNPRAGRGKGGF